MREPEAKEGVSKVVETPAASTKRRGGESKINRADQASENQACSPVSRAQGNQLREKLSAVFQKTKALALYFKISY